LITALNLIWLLLAVSAVGILLISERRRARNQCARIQRLMSVLLVTVSLFPCVSASDDVINFTYVSAGLETRSGFGHSVPDKSDNNTVIYIVLQTLEHLQVTSFYTIFVAICFFGFVFYSTRKSVLRQLPSFVSRAPPRAPVS